MSWLVSVSDGGGEGGGEWKEEEALDVPTAHADKTRGDF